MLWFLASRKEWEELFVNNNYLATIRQKGINGQLRSSRFRSICWKVRRKYLFTVCGCSLSTHYLMPWKITHAGDHWIFQETSLTRFWLSRFIFHRTFANKVEASALVLDSWRWCRNHLKYRSFHPIWWCGTQAKPSGSSEALAEILGAGQGVVGECFQIPVNIKCCHGHLPLFLHKEQMGKIFSYFLYWKHSGGQREGEVERN